MNNAPDQYRGGEQPVSIGDWLLTIFLVSIPIVGLVVLCVWAFGGAGNESKSNWAKAMLIWMCLGFALAALFLMFAMVVGVASSSNMVVP